MIGLMLLAWLLTDVLATYSVLHHRRAFVEPPALMQTPRTAILVAIKGATALTPLFLDALSSQLHADYRLVFALESEDDAALSLLLSLRHRLLSRLDIDIVIAGHSTCRAQKVHNLLAALSSLRPEDRIVVFADADTVPHASWLSRLIRPVALRETSASCGYRLQLPQDNHFASLVVAAIDLSIATAARSWRWNLCWGGSVALDREVLDRLQLARVWERAASDDLTLTAALRARGLRMYVPPHVLVPSPVSYDWHTLFGFAHRQYLLLRTYAFRHWLLVGWTLCVPALAAGVAMQALISGRWWSLGFIVASATLAQLRLTLRQSMVSLVLADAQLATARASIGFARWAWPLIHLVHLAAYLSSSIGRRFTWAGISYRLEGKAVSVEAGTGES